MYRSQRIATIGSAVLGLLVMMPATSAAQASTTFGVKAGLTSATTTVEGYDGTYKQLLGAVGGVFLGLNVSDNLGLQVEGLVSQRGAKNSFGGSAETTFRLAYIDVPVLVRLGNTTAGGMHLHVFTGPQFSFLMSAKESTDGIDGSIDFKDELSSSDFGWTLGAGVEKGNLGLDARYTHGLKNIDGSSSDPVTKNRAFAVMVGIRLR